MIATLDEAQAVLAKEGLHASQSAHRQGLQIAHQWHDSACGVRFSHDCCVLGRRDEHWLAGFPSRGMPVYEIPGTLDELVGLIISVYRQYRQTGGEFWQAVEKVIPNVDQYLSGHQPTAV